MANSYVKIWHMSWTNCLNVHLETMLFQSNTQTKLWFKIYFLAQLYRPVKKNNADLVAGLAFFEKYAFFVCFLKIGGCLKAFFLPTMLSVLYLKFDGTFF